MKKKIFLTALAVLLCSMLFALFAVTVSAEDEIVIGYYQTQSGSQKEAAVPNADGTYTIKSTCFSSGGTVAMADGTKVNKEFYGWFTEDGTFYEPGEVVTFTESTKLFEAYGVTVNNFDDLKSAFGAGSYIRLGADMEGFSGLALDRKTSIVDLNGHNLTIRNDTAASWGAVLTAIHAKRGSYAIMGKGTFTHLERTKDSNGKVFANFESHGYADEENPQDFWIGKDVTIVTPYTLVNLSNAPKTGMPDMKVAGTVYAKDLFQGAGMYNSSCVIFESANITLTGNKAFNITSTSATNYPYMTITIHGGTIQMTDPNGVLFDDILMSNRFVISEITSGKYAISAASAERLSTLIPDTLMLKAETDENGVTWYNVVEADCVHEWALDAENTVLPTINSTGLDVFVCSKCGISKQAITIYSPSETEIVVSVMAEDGAVVKYTVKSSDVYEFAFDGFGVNALCYISALKDNELFTADKLVEIQIPAGVSIFDGVASESIEKITILDGSNIKISVLSTMTALKEIEIGAATVELAGIKAPAIEKITSNVAGATVTFNSDSFKNLMTMTTLELSAGSTYNFASNCFNTTGLTEVIFPDDSTINFTGDAAFYGCPNLTYAYFGRNCISDKKINRKPFDCAYALETVVLMDIVYINEYVFCCNGNASSTAEYREGKSGYAEPLRVYHHGESISINGNAFANRGVLGVEFYTATNTLTSLSNCKYTIYNGIGHRYMQGTITESTCIEQGTAGYYTDCVCGNDYRENAYVVINADGQTECEAYGTEIIYLPLSEVHVMGDVLADIVYENYFAIGTKYYYCSVCNEATLAEEEPSAQSLFIAAGYSTAEGEKMSVSHTIKVNREAVNAYIAIGHDFYFGAVAAINSDGAPVLGVNQVKEGAIMLDMTNTSFDIISVKIVGIPQESASVALNCCAYAIENSDTPIIKYLCDDATLDKAESISYSALVENQPETTVPSDDEE